MSPIEYARSIWPRGFTRLELSEALNIRAGVAELRKLRAIEDTGAKRRHGQLLMTVWRFKPYQLRLPLGEK